MQKIEYEIIDHGVCGSQYFQGCGTTFTSYSECVTGIGNGPQEALKDACEQLACSSDGDIDFSELDQEPMMIDSDYTKDTVPEIGDEYPELDNEIYHYISIRWNYIES